MSQVQLQTVSQNKQATRKGMQGVSGCAACAGFAGRAAAGGAAPQAACPCRQCVIDALCHLVRARRRGREILSRRKAVVGAGRQDAQTERNALVRAFRVRCCLCAALERSRARCASPSRGCSARHSVGCWEGQPCLSVRGFPLRGAPHSGSCAGKLGAPSGRGCTRQ